MYGCPIQIQVDNYPLVEVKERDEALDRKLDHGIGVDSFNRVHVISGVPHNTSVGYLAKRSEEHKSIVGKSPSLFPQAEGKTRETRDNSDDGKAPE